MGVAIRAIAILALCSSVLADFTCETSGRFPDPDDPNCESYYLCSRRGRSTAYTCSGSKFDPSTGRCSAKYICPTSTTPQNELSTFLDGISTIGTNADSSTTAIAIPNGLTTFECETDGRFQDFTDPTCTRYYRCASYNGAFLKTVYYCPRHSYFDPDLMRCDQSYSCPLERPTEGASILEFGTTPVKGERGAKSLLPGETARALVACTKVGRFPDTTDVTCAGYYLCSQYHNGTFVKTPYTCPAKSFFNASLRRCTSSYVCPYTTAAPTETTTTTIDSTTMEDTTMESTTVESTTKESTTKESTTMESTIKENTTMESTTMESTTKDSTTTEQPECPTENGLPIDFSCNQIGRFADANDYACKQYYLCNLLRNGTFIQTPYRCPLDSIFDHNKHICSAITTCVDCLSAAF